MKWEVRYPEKSMHCSPLRRCGSGTNKRKGTRETEVLYCRNSWFQIHVQMDLKLRLQFVKGWMQGFHTGSHTRRLHGEILESRKQQENLGADLQLL